VISQSLPDPQLQEPIEKMCGQKPGAFDMDSAKICLFHFLTSTKQVDRCWTGVTIVSYILDGTFTVLYHI
jgi:hypothetical protein